MELTCFVLKPNLVRCAKALSNLGVEGTWGANCRVKDGKLQMLVIRRTLVSPLHSVTV